MTKRTDGLFEWLGLPAEPNIMELLTNPHTGPVIRAAGVGEQALELLDKSAEKD